MIKLFALPYAGASSSIFYKFENYLTSKIELVPVEFSGKGVRMDAPFYSCFEELVEDTYKYICTKLDSKDDYSIFGYSMGALATYELLKLIDSKNEIQRPKCVFIAAHKPPSQMECLDDLISMNDDGFMNHLLETGGISPAIAKDVIFKEVFLPIIRNDYLIINNYVYSPYDFVDTSTPVTILYGEHDNNGDIKLWDQCLNRRCSYRLFEDGHFFINNYVDLICDVINSSI